MAQASDGSSLTTRQRLLYCAGELGPNALGLIVPSWVLFLYRGNADAGLAPLVPAVVFAAVFLTGRLVDSISDPLVGWWSDRTRTRWGRRKPFLGLSLGPLVAFFVLLWVPPLPHESLLNGLLLLVLLSGFFFSFTCYYAPYLALLPELTPTAAERNRTATWQAGFKVAAMIGATLFGVLHDWVGSGATTNPAHGFLRPALVVAGVALLALLLPLAGPREQHDLPAPAATPLLESIRQTLASRPFRHFVGAFLGCWFGVQIVLAVMPHLPYALYGADPARGASAASALQAAAILTGAASFPLLQWAMNRWGRGRTFAVSLLWFAVTAPLLMLARSLPTAIGVLILAGPAIGGFLVLPHALMADVCDHDARRTGVRREALFFGVQGLIVKAGMGLAVPAADALMETFGRTSAHPTGLLACCAAAGLAALAGLGCFHGFGAALADAPRAESAPA